MKDAQEATADQDGTASGSTRWKPDARLAALLGLLIPPFAYLYLHRPVFFTISLGLSLVAVPFSLHYPMLWIGLGTATAMHAVTLASRSQGVISKRWFATPVGLLLCICITTSAAAIARISLIDVYRVSSGSMMPGLHRNDLLFVAKWRPPRIERGRIYTFRFPDDDGIYVKRLVGMPGDKITMRGNWLIVNDTTITTIREGSEDPIELLAEVLGDHRYLVLDLYDIKKFERDFLVGENEYFFLGDNRSNSIDSRIRGTVRRAGIIGEVHPLRARFTSEPSDLVN